MTAQTIADLRRELQKARDALFAAEKHLAAHAEANAALHCAEAVMYSPLHARVTSAIAQLDHALDRTEQLPGDANDRHLLAVLVDLDRCEHGRHQGDVCSGCGGPSRGNPHMPTGDVVGYDISGKPIVMPDREHKHDASAWRSDERAQRADPR